MRTTTRRSMMATAAVAAMVGATLALVAPAPAYTGLAIHGAAVCNVVTGEYEVTWTLMNGSPEIATVSLAQMTPPDISLVSQLAPIAANGGQDFAIGNAPGTATNVHLALDYTLGSNPTTVIGDADLALAGTCTASAPASLQVGSGVGPGEAVTISGAGCGLVAMNSTAATFDSGGTVTGSIAFAPPLAFGPITAGPDGTWSTSIVVPLGTPAGSYAVSAQCALAANPASLTAFSAVPASIKAQAAGGFAYATKYLTVISAVTATPRQTG